MAVRSEVSIDNTAGDWGVAGLQRHRGENRQQTGLTHSRPGVAALVIADWRSSGWAAPGEGRAPQGIARRVSALSGADDARFARLPRDSPVPRDHQAHMRSPSDRVV